MSGLRSEFVVFISLAVREPAALQQRLTLSWLLPVRQDLQTPYFDLAKSNIPNLIIPFFLVVFPFCASSAAWVFFLLAAATASHTHHLASTLRLSLGHPSPRPFRPPDPENHHTHNHLSLSPPIQSSQDDAARVRIRIDEQFYHKRLPRESPRPNARDSLLARRISIIPRTQSTTHPLLPHTELHAAYCARAHLRISSSPLRPVSLSLGGSLNHPSVHQSISHLAPTSSPLSQTLLPTSCFHEKLPLSDTSSSRAELTGAVIPQLFFRHHGQNTYPTTYIHTSQGPHHIPRSTPTPVYTSRGNGSTNKASRSLPVATYLVDFPPRSSQNPSQQQQVRSPPAQYSTTYPHWVPVPFYRTAHRTEQTHTSAKETRALEPSASENPEFHPTLVLQLPRILPEPVKVPRCPTIYPSALSPVILPLSLPSLTSFTRTVRIPYESTILSHTPILVPTPTRPRPHSRSPFSSGICAHADLVILVPPRTLNHRTTAPHIEATPGHPIISLICPGNYHYYTHQLFSSRSLVFRDDLQLHVLLRAPPLINLSIQQNNTNYHHYSEELLASNLAITTTAVTTTNSSYEVDLRPVAPARSIVERLGLELSTIRHTSSREPEITPCTQPRPTSHLSTMTHRTTQHDAATSNVLAWSTHCANMPSMVEDESADVDEPPETQLPISPITSTFKRNPIRRTTLDHNASLLTKALHSPSEDEDPEARPGMSFFARRRSMASNISLASTADLTSDTGLTSPSRANTPSPPLPEMRLLNIHDEPAKEAPKKRCIQFACAAKPSKPIEPIRSQPMVKAPSAQEPQRRSCIKFACPVPQRPASTQNTPPQRLEMAAARLQAPAPATARKTRSRSPRPTLAPPQVDVSVKSPTTKKYITANPSDLNNESSQFHEFASDIPREDDWIRQAFSSQGRRITIDDTLKKENAIRKLATEAEEEAEQEEEDLATAIDDDEDLDNLEDADDDDDCEDEEEEDEDDEDEDEDDASDEDDNSDGYKTDEETGFADSEEEEEDDDLRLWTPGRSTIQNIDSTPIARRPSLPEQLSDSSIASHSSLRARRGRAQRIKIRPGTPELPDSTDFVCGTLDEDRPMEDAYMSCLAARRREKLQLIPQDIDPSFPASDPEDEGEEEIYNPVHHSSDDEMFFHGKMEDLHHKNDRSRRQKKAEHTPPKRFHSPPPVKRRASPAPKNRGRSPRRLFDGPSPRRLRSPAPQMLKSPPASPRNGHGAITFKTLASRPGLTVTKSLPRPPSMFPHMAKGRRSKAPANDLHIRGAIDIVKGLERKRQRRKEKFYQKYCNRARKGQVPERKPQRGLGCERMRELGLLMAGKIDQGNYVLSV
ncbi:uncharacterized protein CLUP02_04184 [Colletotrichum lupini]|uniref:Uncharacterized protein n=1 Tax=Colletotrichum lupini TaxID=145971 RepID=A0A9Q8SLL8_9PEZI|nr:uncharacterized protein CLUP02_04184 [Colletotrichum lupini]UQC78707.1 hypothetical protein CLUP02_04184 [Colletotrichum lupini]